MAGSIVTLDPVRATSGPEILGLTDRFGFDAFAAGWLYDDGTASWRFILSSPMIEAKGPRWVYERLLKIFRRYPLPEGVSPLEVVVIDPKLEVLLFGEPWLAQDERRNPPGLQSHISHDIDLNGFLVGQGVVFFLRRLATSQRRQRVNPAQIFDMQVSRLAA